MKEPAWLDRRFTLALHDELLARFGGLGGIRDEGMLDSALGRPLNVFAYEGGDIFQLAAAYAAGVVKNHPFFDGNKRTGFMMAYSFLGINGLRFDASEVGVVERTLALAAGTISEEEYAEWLRRSCRGFNSHYGNKLRCGSRRGGPRDVFV